MKIQEVARLTGLSDKTIRYYEQQGLINVDRDDNSYRNYNMNNVYDLNMIRLLRYFSFSLSEIKQVLDDSDKWAEVVEKIDLLQKQAKQDNDKKNVLLEVIRGKDYVKVWEESYDLLNEVDTELDEEFFEELEYLKSPSLFSTIMVTILYSGPILGLLFNVFEIIDFVELKVLVPFALLSTVGVTLNWNRYCRNRNKDLKRSNAFISFGLIVISLGLLFATLLLLTFIQEKLFVREETYFFVMNSKLLGYLFLIALIGQLLTLFFGTRKKLTGDRDFEGFEDVLIFMKKFKIVIVILNILLVYIFLTSVSTINKDGSIVRFGPLNLKGKQYTVSEINEVIVGYNKGFLKQYKNDFSMVLVTDGFHLDIVEANTLEEAPTYSELEKLDVIYSKQQIKKTVKNDNRKYCTYDKQYCDLFERIIKGESR